MVCRHQAETVSLLDAKTANNIAIAISRFKMTCEEIAKVIAADCH